MISQALYFRGGNTTDELITVVLLRDGVPMRYFPIGAKGDVHVPLRVVEDIEGGSVVELQLAAPVGRHRHGRRRPRHGGALMTSRRSSAHGDAVDERRRQPTPAGRDRQRHGRRPGGRGDPRPRRRRAVRDHHVRRRAVRQLQPDHALPRAVRRGGRRATSSSTAATGTSRTTSPCTPGSGSPGSTGSPSWCTPTTARSPPYDKLIIATGSRSFMPPMDGPAHRRRRAAARACSRSAPSTTPAHDRLRRRTTITSRPS